MSKRVAKFRLTKRASSETVDNSGKEKNRRIVSRVRDEKTEPSPHLGTEEL